MLAFPKRRQFIFALVLLFALSLIALLSFTLGRNHKREVAAQPLRANPATAKPDARSLSLDSDNDGLPDAAELESFTDRESFRNWFTLIAEGQFYHLSNDWNVEQRDCSGLVRYAWREALRRHDRLWFQKMGPGYPAIGPDVKRYQLEDGPLGEKIFRTSFGSYKERDLSNGSFSEFADARSLKSFNTKFIGRDRHNAQPGDLLFFHQPWVQKFPFHVMVYLGEAKLGAEKAKDWVVYHTGSSPTDSGTVKKVRLSILDQHPNKRWRPVESNSNFLGFYRLKILD
ncbi:MAG TPA: DUF1175 family protein [Pyrinomonadaceae bacterium]|nr:DUF1175 family protein [Pyrinomonadaceae bacterium]